MAELTLSAADIAAAIKKNLDGLDDDIEARTVGRVSEVGDGIARVSGLPDAVTGLIETYVAAGGPDTALLLRPRP